VRLYGCNVQCSYCDQPQTKADKHKISVERLIQKIEELRVKRVCITGGEPLIQADVYSVIYDLVGKDYDVSIETNGCTLIDPDPYIRSYRYVMDIKCPSSGVANKNVFENLMNLQSKDEVKFVIANRKDYDFFLKTWRSYPTLASILLSPVIKKTIYGFKPFIGQDLVKWILEDKLFNVRINLQAHKFLKVS